jgi:hypoxanthine phosphoribosyltransferase
MQKRKEPNIRVLLSKEEIGNRVTVLGQEISKKHANLEDPLILIGILKGSVIFLSDLCRAISLPVELEFMGVSSYGDETKSSGVVQITQDLTRPIKGRHIILVEDIVDTGLTAQYLLKHFRTRDPASVAICALLEKPDKSLGQIPIDFLGFSIPDDFVVGYGLDFAGIYRNLPHVGIVEMLAN